MMTCALLTACCALALLVALWRVASYVFASDPSLRRVAAGRRGLPGVFVDVLAGDSNEGVVVALLRALTVWAMKRWLRRSGGIACGRRRC